MFQTYHFRPNFEGLKPMWLKRESTHFWRNNVSIYIIRNNNFRVLKICKDKRLWIAMQGFFLRVKNTFGMVRKDDELVFKKIYIKCN